MTIPEGASYLTTQEVAKELRITRRTVIQEIHRGKLEAIMAGNALRIPVESFKTYLEKQRVKPGQNLEETDIDEAA